MLRIFHNTNYDVIKFWKPRLLVIGLVVLAGAISFILTPVNLSLEFRGGTLVQVDFLGTPPTSAQLRSALEEGGIHDPQIQPFGNNHEFAIRAVDPVHVAEQDKGAESIVVRITSILGDKFGASNVQIKQSEAIGPRVGAELTKGAFMAVLVSMIAVLIYLAWRFEWRFGVAAVVATMHDVFATIAFIKLMNLEVSLTVVAGVLTVLG